MIIGGKKMNLFGVIRKQGYENKEYVRVYQHKKIPRLYAIQVRDFFGSNKVDYEVRVGGIVGGCGNHGNYPTIKEAEKAIVILARNDFARYRRGGY